MCAAAVHAPDFSGEVAALTEAMNDIDELMQSNEVATFLATPKTARRNRLKLMAKRAELLYKKAQRKASKHLTPHGYGNGYYECPCPRCERAIRLEVEAEDAFAAWKSAVALYAATRARV